MNNLERGTVVAATILLSMLMAGCVRSSVDRLTPDTAYITAKGGVQYDMGDIQREMLLQAANVTLESGYDYFTVTGADGYYSTGYMTVPGQTTTQTNFNAYATGNMLSGSATTNSYTMPSSSFAIEKPRGAMSIKMGHDTPPAGDPNSFDAREVKSFLEAQ
jgi:hypothetical protein